MKILFFILIPAFGFGQIKDKDYIRYKKDSINMYRSYKMAENYSRKDSAKQAIESIDRAMSYSESIDSLIKILRKRYPTLTLMRTGNIWKKIKK